MTTETPITINHCVKLVREAPGLLKYLKTEEIPSQKKILSEFFELHVQGWAKKRNVILYGIQKELGLNLGYCFYFESPQLKEKENPITEESDIRDYCTKTGEREQTACYGLKQLCPFRKDE